jgi:glycine cleavage system H protein
MHCVAQVVRAPDCGSGGRGFEPHRGALKKASFKKRGFFICLLTPYFGPLSKSLNMTFPENLKYTSEHEWIRMEGNEAFVGVTDFAQGELGDIVYVDINTSGQAIAKDAVFGSVEAVKTVSDLFLPVAGTILEVNPALADAPELVNSDPYGAGWMVRISLSDPAELEGLMDSNTYKASVGA